MGVERFLVAYKEMMEGFALDQLTVRAMVVSAPGEPPSQSARASMKKAPKAPNPLQPLRNAQKGSLR